MIKNLNINDYYFHSIIHGAKESLKVINNIMKTGSIKSPQSLGAEFREGCHRPNEICLSHITQNAIEYDTRSCFDIYVARLTSFIIDKEIAQKFQIVKPKVITTDEIFLGNYDDKTNLYDEYRTTHDIPVEYIKGVCIPYKDLLNLPLTFVPFVIEDILIAYYNGDLDWRYRERVLDKERGQQAFERRKHFLDDYIDKLQSILQKYHSDIPIYHYQNDNQLILR